MSVFTEWKRRFPNSFSMARTAYLYSGSIILSVFAVSRFSIALYYFLFDHSFWREQHSVAKGIIRYSRKNNQISRMFLLRRNIHRLEKGLSIQPRKPTFALDYIQETVNIFQDYRHTSDNIKDDPIMQWSEEVLSKYFQSVANDTTINKAKETFLTCSEITQHPLRIPTPYRIREGASHGIALEDLANLSRARRSVRWFQDKQVSRKLIDDALTVAAQAPSSCNRQPYQYRIFDDRKLVQAIANLPRGTAGFAHNIPCLVAVVGNLSSFSGNCDRHGIYIDAGLSVMGFLYALDCVGLGSCILNWPDVESLEKRVEKILGLNTHERVVMMIALGYPDPDGLIPHSAKTSLNDLRSFNVATSAKI